MYNTSCICRSVYPDVPHADTEADADKETKYRLLRQNVDMSEEESKSAGYVSRRVINADLIFCNFTAISMSLLSGKLCKI